MPTDGVKGKPYIVGPPNGVTGIVHDNKESSCKVSRPIKVLSELPNSAKKSEKGRRRNKDSEKHVQKRNSTEVKYPNKATNRPGFDPGFGSAVKVNGTLSNGHGSCNKRRLRTKVHI